MQILIASLVLLASVHVALAQDPTGGSTFDSGGITCIVGADGSVNCN